MAFQESVKGVLSFQGVSGMFQVRFKGDYKTFQWSLTGVSRKVQEWFKEALGKFQGV